MATYVLVHGAWHGGWCWWKVTPRLQAAGHTVYTPTLTGLGERAHLGHADVGLGTHVQDVVSVVECEDLAEVVLVGHSYGGMAISGVAERVPERLAHLVYLDAFVPADGQALLDLVPPQGRPGMEARVRAEGDGWRLAGRLPMPWSQAVQEDYHVTDPAEVAWMSARLGPQPFKTFTEPVRLTSAAAAALPRTYIRCVNGVNPAFDRAAEHARQPGSGWRHVELPTWHDAMVTLPEPLVDALLAVSAPGSGRPAAP